MLQQMFMFTLPEIEIVEKMWTYDANAAFADAGGFLGLLIGTSCLSLADIFLTYCSQWISRKKNVK